MKRNSTSIKPTNLDARSWGERPSAPLTDHLHRGRGESNFRVSMNPHQSRNVDLAHQRNEYYGPNPLQEGGNTRATVGVSQGRELGKLQGSKQHDIRTRTSSFRPSVRSRHGYDPVGTTEADIIPIINSKKNTKKLRMESESGPGLRTVSRGSRFSEISKKQPIDVPNMLFPRVPVQEKVSRSSQVSKNPNSALNNAFKELANLSVAQMSALSSQNSFLSSNIGESASQYSQGTKNQAFRVSKTTTENVKPSSQESKGAPTDMNQPHLSLNAGNPAKTVSLMPARSSSFLFNGREAFYAVNTTNGMIRTYNEDRVSIVINVKRKQDWKATRWPNCSYFSVFDGHGGALCADFLKDNLHKFILENQHFPGNPVAAIEEGCAQAEHDFCKFALRQTNIEKSGSCGLIVLIIDDKAYVGNVGDSRAIVSEFGGKSSSNLTKDHKPEEAKEKERIERAGGKVMKNNYLENYKFLMPILNTRLNELPFRLYPGGLSVSRSFGDIMAKDVSLGGNPHVLIAKPDVFVYTIEKNTDFIFIGCDGIFDKWDTPEIVDSVWAYFSRAKDSGIGDNRNRLCEGVVNTVIMTSMRRLSYDNLTGIFLNFNAF